MKRFRFFTITTALALCFTAMYAQVQKGLKTYNVARAIEEINNDNPANAMSYLTKEISENPDNGYAYYVMSVVELDNDDMHEAMKDINLSIKKLPKKDKEYYALANALRATIYTQIGDTISGLEDFKTALKINPESTKILNDYGQLLYELKRYDEADKLYHRIIELEPTDVVGYMGLGRNADDLGKYDEAIEQYNKVLRMHNDYSSGYSFRAGSYMKKGLWAKAADDIVKALSIDRDLKAQYLMYQFPADKLPLLISKLKAMAIKDPTNSDWYVLTGHLYSNNYNYRQAIDAYNKALEITNHPDGLKDIAECYSSLGEYPKALDAINRAMQMNSDEIDYIAIKADILGDSGDVEGAIAEWGRYIDKNPDYPGGYYGRGFVEDNSNRTDEALADYEMTIMLDPDYAYAYLGKGDMLMRKGMQAEAQEAYRKVVELDTVPNNESCAMYALLALGEKDKAIDFMERVIAGDPNNADNYYDGACFYSRTGDVDKSLANLQKALELGFRRIHHIYADDDLEALRATDAFKALMEQYKQPLEPTKESETESATLQEVTRVEIPYTPEAGCAKVKCTINELPLSFIFDTGASTVSLSMVEANFMLKNGYLKKEDFVGSQLFVDANGDISEGTIVNLRSVDFGGAHLNNIKASVVRNQKAPLLLGQSVLSRLGSIEIDNLNKKLIITNYTKTK